MDLTNIKSSVLNQLTNTNGLYSLKLQNHIYGCFIIMEDLAQGGVSLSGTILSTPKYSIDLDNQFSTIGVRYGFALDTHLVLDTFNKEYHNTWIQYFKDIYSAKDIKDVDNIEDCLIEIIQTCVKLEDAFFITALETGSLPQEWIEKILKLLHPSLYSISTKEEPERDEEIQKTAIAQANVEKSTIDKCIVEKSVNNRNHLSLTRRAHLKVNTTSFKKKTLSKTRRQHTTISAS